MRLDCMAACALREYGAIDSGQDAVERRWDNLSWSIATRSNSIQRAGVRGSTNVADRILPVGPARNL